MDGRAVVRPHSTGEGGEPQGSREGRPRDPLEGRGEQPDVPIGDHMATHGGRAPCPQQLSRLTERAKADKTARFLSIAHLLTPAALMAAFEGLRKDASAGVDNVTYAEYERADRANVQQLHDRLVSHQYPSAAVARVYIPKEDGKQRPISIPALEDKIVQKATVMVLNAIYEQDFLPCSDGFRPGQSPHDALDAVRRTILSRSRWRTSWKQTFGATSTPSCGANSWRSLRDG